MNAGLAADLALRSTVLLAGAWAAAAVIRSRGGSAAVRHAVWMLGLAMLACLPLLAWTLPPVRLPILPAEPAAQPIMAAASTGAASSAPLPAPFDVTLAIYLAVAAILLARLAIGRLLLERAWRRAAPIGDPRASILVADLGGLLGVRRPIAIRIAARPVAPMTWGSLRPRVLLPPDAVRWSSERWRSVLLHELGHISRHDSLGSVAAECVCAFYWPHPGCWYAARQMRLAQEQACDDLVLANGAAAPSYARHLLDSACALHPRLSAAATGMAGRSDLEQRLRSILGERRRNRPSALFLGSAALAVATCGALIAAVAPVAARSNADVPSAPQPLYAPAPLPAEVLAPAPVSRVAERRRPHSVPQIFAAAAPVPVPSQADAYAAEMTKYDRELADYRAGIERYNVELAAYRSATDVYQRRREEYRARMAALGPSPPPSVTLPTAPTAPTAPTYPTAPTEPTEPVTPPRLPHSI